MAIRSYHQILAKNGCVPSIVPGWGFAKIAFVPAPSRCAAVSVVAFYSLKRYNRYNMPKCNPDPDLLHAIEAFVQSAGGNESEAARKLGTTRLRINRIRKRKGAATPAVRDDLWRRIQGALSNPSSADLNDTFDTKTIQIVRDVPHVALQVLRYMKDAIERDIGAEGQIHAR